MPPLAERDCPEIAPAGCEGTAVPFAEIMAARTLEMGAGIRPLARPPAVAHVYAMRRTRQVSS
jgi:hypothetical protein